jgi:predicted NodU family carbamoyl transferase
MVVCGISGRRRQAAAALSIDGRLVSAAEQAPLSRTDKADDRGALLPMAAIDACLASAGLTVRDISHFVRADGYAATLECSASHRRFQYIGSASARGYNLSRLAAFARVVEAVGARAALVADGPAAMLVSADGAATDLARARGLLGLACRLATALGLDHDDSAGALAALEQLAASFEPSGQDWFEPLAAAADQGSVAVDASAFDKALAVAAAEAGAPLADVTTPLVRKARVVADVADAFLSAVASHFGQLAAAAGPGVMLAGGLFGSPDFVSRVRRAAGWPCPVAPCPSTHGAALGAALSCAPLASDAIPSELALGPTATEADAKAVLENCRLDYIYEPRWPRLLERVSRVLERGKLVAWFQGRAEFGHPFYGSRSFLCDPSNRYARDNINVFLRRRPLSAPIPLSIPFAARECVDTSEMSSLTLTRAAVGVEWRDRLRAATDGQGYAHVHVLPEGSGPLADLLAIHSQRTGVPGLANLPLCAPDDVPAVSPRDAVRAAYASAADALVIHRFVVMKDYWQMRDEATTHR